MSTTNFSDLKDIYLFGSKRLKQLCPNLNRKCKDEDWFTPNIDAYNEYNLLINSQDNKSLYYIPILPNRDLDINSFYTLKVSHSLFNIHWFKHLNDILFLQSNNPNLKLDKKLHKELVKYWLTRHGRKQINFKQNKELFFKDNINRKVDHDELHSLLTRDITPSYKQGLREGEEVSIDFDSLGDKLKFNMLYEELFIIALERFNNYPLMEAYYRSALKLCTELLPIKVATFLVDNWISFSNPLGQRHLFDSYNYLYIHLFK